MADSSLHMHEHDYHEVLENGKMIFWREMFSQFLRKLVSAYWVLADCMTIVRCSKTDERYLGDKCSGMDALC